MCGIFAYIGNQIDPKILEDAFLKTSKRGPDNNILKSITQNLVFGFHRLSIMDVSFKGNQPIYHPNKPYCLIKNFRIMKTLKKSKAKNLKKVIEILNLNELLQIRGGGGESEEADFD